MSENSENHYKQQSF